MSDGFVSRRVSVNGVSLHFVESGPVDGPPVLLLHGFPESWRCYHHQLRALGTAGFRVIAPDLRGYDQSDKPEGVSSYHLDQLSADVAGLVSALGYQRVALVGHDWGGLIAWDTAGARYRHVVERLIIINCPHLALYVRRMSLRQLCKSWYIMLFQLPYVGEWWVRRKDFKWLQSQLRRSAVPSVFSEADVARIKLAMAQTGALTAAINYYRGLLRLNLLRLGKRYTPISVPTMLIWGEQDPYLGKELTYDTAAWATDLRIDYIPEAGHWVHMERPEKVNHLMIDFLKSPSRRGAP